MKKERHPVYRLLMAGLLFLLAVGIALVVLGAQKGNSSLFLSPPLSI